MSTSAWVTVAWIASPASGQVPPVFPLPAPSASPAVGNVIALGDLDGDGDLDGAADSWGRIAVARNDGLGNLLIDLAPSQSNAPLVDFVLADFDADGDLDLVHATGFVEPQIRFNGGFGDYTSPSFFPALPLPWHTRHLAVEDVDGDGRMDLIAAGKQADVRLGDGAGGFSSGESFHLRAPASSIDIGDFDGDGRFDLALLATDADALMMLRGRDGGTFAELPLAFGFGGPTALAVTRWNGDSFDDLLIAQAFDGCAVQYLGDGQFHFAKAGRIGGGSLPLAVAAADLDHDGDSDAVVADSDQFGLLHVAMGDGTGALGPSVSRNDVVRPRGLALGDMDRDGRLEAIAGSNWNGGISVLFDLEVAKPVAPVASVTITGSARDFGFADLDVDGDPDLIVVRDGPGYDDVVDTYLSDGLGGFAPASSSNAFLVNAPTWKPADHDADGVLDLAISAGQQIFVYRGNGAGFAPTPILTASTTGHSVLDVVDFGGDARPDLVAIGNTNLFRVVNTGQTGSITATNSALGTHGGWTGATTSDWNGDGHAEALVVKSGTIRVLSLASGPPTMIAQVPTQIQYGFHHVDLDGDGERDLLGWRSTSDGFVSTVIEYGLGGAAFGPSILIAAGSGGSSLVLADFDRDGGIDIARSQANEQVGLLRLDGSGFVRGIDQYHVPFETLSLGVAPRIAAVDFDFDGDLDLATAPSFNAASTAIVFLENVSRPGGNGGAVAVGSGCPGPTGIAPSLATESGSAAGGAILHSFFVTNAPPATAGFLVFAAGAPTIPAPGTCAVYIGIAATAVPFVTPTSPSKLTSVSIGLALHPSSSLPTFSAQAFLPDATLATGFSATNALWVRGN